MRFFLIAILVMIFTGRANAAHQYTQEEIQAIGHHYNWAAGIRSKNGYLIDWPTGQLGAEPTPAQVAGWITDYNNWKASQDDANDLAVADTEVLHAVEIMLYQMMDTGSVTVSDLTTAIIDKVNERRDKRGDGPLPGTTYP